MTGGGAGWVGSATGGAGGGSGSGSGGTGGRDLIGASGSGVVGTAGGDVTGTASSGVVGSAGSPGTGGSSTGGSSTGGPLLAAETGAPSATDGGCGCSVPRRSRTAGGAVLLTLSWATALRWRRRVARVARKAA